MFISRTYHFLKITIALFVFANSANGQQESGFESLFDGHSLNGWSGDSDHWSVVDGCITGSTTADKKLKHNTFLVWDGEVKDFELRLKVKLLGGNTGIQFRSQLRDPKLFRVIGYQADFDAANTYSGINYDEGGRGIIAQRGKRTVINDQGKPQEIGDLGTNDRLVHSIKKNDWNDYRIVAVGNRIQQFINGVQTIDLTDEDERNRDMKGLLALQVHTGPPMTVMYKDIRIRHLTGDAEPELFGEKKVTKKVVFVAGKKSHGYGSHEHYAGSILLAKRLESAFPELDATVVRNGWPSDSKTEFEGADCIVIYADGGKRHPSLPHLDELDELMKSGVGLACLHYGVEVPKGEAGDKFVDWIGGYFETHWSVNPHWTADFVELPDHPITRGVKPFKLHDEWYFHMRFRENMAGVTPILSAVAPESTMVRPDGPHSGNPAVRKSVADGDLQHVAWCAERTGWWTRFWLDWRTFPRSLGRMKICAD